jgi:hypothetical protein
MFIGYPSGAKGGKGGLPSITERTETEPERTLKTENGKHYNLLDFASQNLRGQVNKFFTGRWWMPWEVEVMKDVACLR